MSTDERAFLAAIAAEPDDDTARLVYADWLDEHGEPLRAMVIRRGVKKPKRFTFGPGEPARVTFDQDERCDLPRRIDVKLASGYNDLQWETYKGTIAAAWCSWETWLTVSPVLVGHELLSEVVLTTMPEVSFGSSHVIIPGRQNAYPIDPSEGPVRTALKNEWPWVKRWSLPEPIVGIVFTTSPAGVVIEPDSVPDIGDTVKLLDGSKGVLASEVDDRGWGLVRRFMEVRK
jgi:uncharacterized protein (TIGR02996 family)